MLLFRILRLRDHGRLLPRHRLAVPPAVIGGLLVREEQLEAGNRSARVARLLAAGTGVPLPEIPPLYDAVLVHYSCGRMTLSGVEHLPDDLGLATTAFAQSWLLTAADDPDHAPPPPPGGAV